MYQYIILLQKHPNFGELSHLVWRFCLSFFLPFQTNPMWEGAKAATKASISILLQIMDMGDEEFDAHDAAEELSAIVEKNMEYIGN